MRRATISRRCRCLQGLTEEPVVLQTREISEGGNRKAFTVTYFGVTLAEWSCVKTEGVLAWEI